MAENRCEGCYTDRSECINCIDNPIYENVPRKSLYSWMKPVCPYGYQNCIYDPGYIKKIYPEEYARQFGNIPPDQAVETSMCIACFECKNSPYYDDEDK